MTLPGQHVVEGFVRAGARPEPVDASLQRLRDLAETGIVAELGVRSWPRSVALDTATDDRFVDIYHEFEAWAASQGASITPPFAERDVDETIVGESRHELVMPVLCVAIYDRAGLAGVFPHTVAGETYTVQTLLETLAARQPLEEASPAVRATDARAGTAEERTVEESVPDFDRTRRR